MKKSTLPILLIGGAAIIGVLYLYTTANKGKEEPPSWDPSGYSFGTGVTGKDNPLYTIFQIPPEAQVNFPAPPAGGVGGGFDWSTLFGAPSAVDTSTKKGSTVATSDAWLAAPNLGEGIYTSILGNLGQGGKGGLGGGGAGGRTGSSPLAGAPGVDYSGQVPEVPIASKKAAVVSVPVNWGDPSQVLALETARTGQIAYVGQKAAPYGTLGFDIYFNTGSPNWSDTPSSGAVSQANLAGSRVITTSSDLSSSERAMTSKKLNLIGGGGMSSPSHYAAPGVD